MIGITSSNEYLESLYKEAEKSDSEYTDSKEDYFYDSKKNKRKKKLEKYGDYQDT